ncbi:MAG: YrdB family protein [Anaerolineaceae bacterium]|nr:YrdB family protein [Anaerolineaceae bacterium]
MGLQAVNLALRFFLELAALAAMAYWGWTTHEGAPRFLWTIGLPVVAAALWGIFRVPNDPGPAPVAVPGRVRLLLEALFFGGAVVLLVRAGQPVAAGILAALLVIHYVAAHQRVVRLGRMR